jgi:hypothetical protein
MTAYTPNTSPSFVDVRRRFGFRTIEMGRWVTPAERDRAAGSFYRALGDLMTTLGVPEAVISLRGQLSLQYGKGGQLGVAAHYMPATQQLALAKNAGAGSLAHEWFHAFDHYIADKAFANPNPLQFASSAWFDQQPGIPHTLNDRLTDCFQAIFSNADGAASPLVAHAMLADRLNNRLYYALPEELCARAFEAFVEDCGPGNRFLVCGTRQSEEARAGLYPNGHQRQCINEAFAGYFLGLGRAVEKQITREAQARQSKIEDAAQ